MTRRAKRQTEARRADKYDLYQRAVQEPEADVPLINRIYRKRYGRSPRTLREDFCGTALMACTWVKSHAENRAVAIDLDPEPLAWGARHNVAALTPDQQARVKLIQGNVLDVGHEKVDVTVGFNFSFFLFTTRKELRRYFEQARASLVPEGLLFLDAYGGPEAQTRQQEERKVGGFTYVWDQHDFDPISHRGRNFIHFEFKDGSRLHRAFRYQWRVWSIPELRELLEEAGFRETEVYWEGTDSETGEGNNVFTRRERALDDPAWIAYLVAAP